MWVLGTELESSARVLPPLNHCAISPAEGEAPAFLLNHTHATHCLNRMTNVLYDITLMTNVLYDICRMPGLQSTYFCHPIRMNLLTLVMSYLFIHKVILSQEFFGPKCGSLNGYGQKWLKGQ